MLPFYYLKREVTFDILADFCSQCGKVVYIKKVKNEMLLVEIAVDAATVAVFVAKHVVYAVSKRFFPIVQLNV